MPKITIYTDGGAVPNPGVGAHAAIIVETDDQGNVVSEREIVGGDNHTTNNAMEITAVIEGLKALPARSEVTVVADSKYVINTITKGWKRNANHELWHDLDALCANHRVSWQFVKGHAGHHYNERCDRLAAAEIDRRRRELYPEDYATASVETSTNTLIFAHIDCGGANFGRCGWSAIIVENGQEHELSGGRTKIAKYEISIMAAIAALKRLTGQHTITFYIDSDFVINGITSWINNWRKNGWRNSKGKPVEYRELWEELFDLSQRHKVDWKLLKKNIPDEYWRRIQASAAQERTRA